MNATGSWWRRHTATHGWDETGGYRGVQRVQGKNPGKSAEGTGGTGGYSSKVQGVIIATISGLSRFAQGILAVLRAKPARVAGLILEATHFLEHGMLRTEAKTFFRKCKFLQLLATAGKRAAFIRCNPSLVHYHQGPSARPAACCPHGGGCVGQGTWT